MASAKNYDLIVIGAGPGGYVGAIRAAQLGLKVAVVEKHKAGGVCLNIGCIPSKALIEQANRFDVIEDLQKLGVSVDTGSFEYRKVFQRSRDAADALSRGVEYLLRKNNIELIKGTAKIVSRGKVSVDTVGELNAENILVATGSHPRQIPGFEFDGKQIMSSDDVLMLTELPESLVILGGGAIGVEFAHIMNAFGVKVHIVEMLDRVLPLEDEDVAEVLRKDFTRRGIKISTGMKAESIKKRKKSLEITVSTGDRREELHCEKLLVVVGRAPNSDRLGLEQLGIKTERGYVQVGDYYQTSVPGIFAIGDLINSPMLAHVASKEAEIAVEFIAGKHPPVRLDPDQIPSAVYCEPQVASFGPTEEALKKLGTPYKKATFPYRGAGKAVAVNKKEGLVKILFDPKIKEILACHIAGAEATELIHEMLLAKSAELLPEDIATMVHAHPTLSEVVMEGMRAAEGWAIHV